MSNAALNGLLIVDLTQFEAGTVCTQLLGMLGARVLKIEKPRVGEVSRAIASEPGKDSLLFMMSNTNKQSVTLDIKSQEGTALLRKLIARADVLVENFRPGYMQGLGLDFEALRPLNERLIYCSIKGFRSGSPWEHALAFDPVAQASGGAMSITGTDDGPPLRCGPNLGDSGAGIYAAVAVLAALNQRQTSGRGQLIEVAMQDCVISLSRSAFAANLITGRAAPRLSNGLPGGGSAPSGVYPCLGGGPNDYCVIHTSRVGNVQWLRLLDAIGRPDLKDDPRFATPAARYERKAEVDELITAWTSRRTKFEVMRVLGEHGVPAAAVQSTQDLLEDDFLRTCGMLPEVNHPHCPELRVPGLPFTLSASPSAVAAPPLLGEHTREALAELAGCSAEELDELQARGVI